SEPERRDSVLRRCVRSARGVPDAHGRAGIAESRSGQRAVRAAEVPAVPRAWGHPERPANIQPGAGPPHVVRSPAARLDSRLAARAEPDSAGDPHARVLARAPEVVLP